MTLPYNKKLVVHLVENSLKGTDYNHLALILFVKAPLPDLFPLCALISANMYLRLSLNRFQSGPERTQIVVRSTLFVINASSPISYW